MHRGEKSDPSIVAGKPASGDRSRSWWSEGRGPRRTRDKPARAGLRAGQACPLDWTVYGHFAVKHPRWEPDAGCVRRSWYELASASLVRPKPSKQDGSESYGRHGNVGSGAWTAVGRGVGLTPEIGLSRRPSWRPHQRRQHIRSRYARGRMHRRGLRPGHVRTAHTGT